MNPKTAVFFGLLASALFIQSCSKPDTGPKTKVEITLLEEVKDTELMEVWLRDFAEESTDKKCAVEVVSESKSLAVEIPADALGKFRAALKQWSGPKANGFGMHAVKRGTPEEATAVASGAITIAGHKALPFQSRPREYLIVKTESVVEFREIEKASAVYGAGGWEISIEFSPSAAKKMLAFTTANKNEEVALVLNDEILTAPNINEPFSSGCQITGNFTMDEARAVARGITNPPPTKFSVTPKAKPTP